MITYATKPQNMQTDQLTHWMLSWNTSKTIHSHVQTGPSRAIAITLNIHMMSNNQKKNNPQGNRQDMQKTVISTRVDNNRIQQGENVVKTRYGRTVRKPDRLTYQ